MEEALTQAGQLQAEDCVSHLRQAWEAWQGQQLRRDDVTLIVVDL
jgi:serine phosphatase RsbU (regulator of sigma subunit)